MIDIFTVVVPHVLMGIAVWRLIHCDELDNDPLLPGATSAFDRVRRRFGGAADNGADRDSARGA